MVVGTVDTAGVMVAVVAWGLLALPTSCSFTIDEVVTGKELADTVTIVEGGG